MDPLPQLPPRECHECPDGNRSMTHVRTVTERAAGLGPDGGYNSIAIFRCSTCGHVAREAFDPNAPTN
jgi:hypothetical protein